MKRIKQTLFALTVLTVTISGCSSDESSEKEADIKVNEIQNCVYTYVPGKSDLRFTAYKFLNKTGVGGTFSSYQVDGDLTGAVPKDIIESMSFSIPTSTVETNNLDRNKKIDSLFFGNLENTALLTGKVVQLNEENGMATLEITMNDITNDVEGEYTLVDNKFNFSADIDVNQWNAQKGLSALNEACYDLHTDVANGDTVSKLWPDVSLEFETILEKKCD